MGKQRVVVAMSGGVDSSVAAALLQEAGYEVVGVTMQLWCDREEGASENRPCCSVEDVQDAQRVAGVLDIPFYVLNMEKDFKRYVVDVFWDEYNRGRTPNPCILCNQHVKFRLLLQKALSLGADYLATGHYARVEEGKDGYHLLKGLDPGKDQSYVLYTLGQEELRRLLLPLGNFHKTEIRRMAADRGLPVAMKPDSQEVCFVYRRGRRDFEKPGDVVDATGRFLGKHMGIAYYTIGQRRGLGLALGDRAYVIGLDPMANRVVVGSGDDLMGRALTAASPSWVEGNPPNGPYPCAVEAKIRYRAPQARAMLSLQEGRALVEFVDGPQRAIAPGQAVVFYRGDEVLGGATIEEATPSHPEAGSILCCP